ncbi:hypothetical protein GGR21_003014 [Dysgonomonas hofstadii]|uniref:YcxB-like C-terminal domain-containing protein n=1 Tax=Dysgonomonas hofstadii TaxID=637886 RepID=A0A840CR01_9BACT|nr:YcxB family protein [Dysgonomonas hofstadii]MBB4037099.1 hypothetical protein [Dysgonomonas hofstadii]
MIELSYTLDKDDYLAFQLFAATKNPLFKRQHRKSRILVFLLFATVGAVFLNFDTGLACYIFIFAAIVFLIYPFFGRRYSKSYLEKHVEQTFDPDCRVVSVSIDDRNVNMVDKKSTGSVKLSELVGITEIKDYFFMQVNKASYIIIPKGKIENVDALRNHLLECSKKLNITYSDEMDWKWK